MSEINEPVVEETTTPEPEVKETGFMATIKAAVAALVPGTRVRAEFEKQLADKRAADRVGILNSAFDLLVKHQAALSKLRAVSPGYEADGTTKLPAIFQMPMPRP